MTGFNSLTILQFPNKHSLAFPLQSNEVYTCAQAVVRNQVRGNGPMSNLTQNMFLVGLLACVISLGGCASNQNPYIYQGAGVGAAVGAAIGAGTNAKDPGKGAAIGGLLGGAVGAVGGELYGQYQQPSQPQQGYYQQPGYGYPPPNQGYNRSPYYGQPSYGQSGPPPGY
jgi:Glycine zipper